MLDQTSLKRGNRGHSRAGNAMERSRKALLDGARGAISAKGLSGTSMVDVADYGQVARATLYNHFRSKEDLWTALIIDELERVSTLFRAEKTFEAGLMALAQAIGTNPMLRTIVGIDPTTLAVLMRTDQGPIWTQIEARFALLAKERKVTDSAGVNLAFRWLLSQVASPIEPEFLPSATSMVARVVKLPAVLF